MAQPYPLFAIVIVPGHPKPYVGRVVGWERVDDGPAGVLAPVLTLGARTFVPGESDHVAYEESLAKAERRAPLLADAARHAEKDMPGIHPVPEPRAAR